jgi:hypothetical protein
MKKYPKIGDIIVDSFGACYLVTAQYLSIDPFSDNPTIYDKGYQSIDLTLYFNQNNKAKWEVNDCVCHDNQESLKLYYTKSRKKILNNLEKELLILSTLGDGNNIDFGY